MRLLLFVMTTENHLPAKREGTASRPSLLEIYNTMKKNMLQLSVENALKVYPRLMPESLFLRYLSEKKKTGPFGTGSTKTSAKT